MRKRMPVVLCFLALFNLPLHAEDEGLIRGKKAGSYPFYVYYDKSDKKNHYLPSGWMGDFGDLKISENCTNRPQSGKTCIQIRYTAEKKQGAGWAGIYWQNPANNWGTSKGGYDLSAAKKLFFWARGQNGGEVVEFKMGGITGEYNDSTLNTSGTVELKKEWELFEIDLAGSDLYYISGGFCFVLSEQGNPDGCAFYIDNIRYSDKTDALEQEPGKIKK